MEYRRVRGTDLTLSAVTYGSMTFVGQEGEAGPRTEEGVRALHLALDRGVNCIHSSYEYGTRHAIGRVLRERADGRDVKHIIKVRTFVRAAGNVPDPSRLRLRVEEALRETGARRIDIVQWIIARSTRTRPRPGDADAFMADLAGYRDDVMAEYEKLRDEGKLGWMGHFAYNDEYAGRMVDSGLIRVLLFYHNLWDTTILPTLDRLHEADMSAVVLRPFHGGMLTTKRADRNAVPPDDKWRKEDRMRLLEDRDRLFEAVGLKSDRLTETTLKFDLAHPNIASVICGMNTREQVREVVGMVDGRYPDPALHRRLFDACARLGVGATL